MSPRYEAPFGWQLIPRIATGVIVVDSSVAFKWFVAEPHVDAAMALSVRAIVGAGPYYSGSDEPVWKISGAYRFPSRSRK